MTAIERASAGLDRACLILAKLALGGMVLAVLLQIVARYVFDYPFIWTEELARYLMVWAGLLGATCAFRRNLDPVILRVPADAARVRIVITSIVLAATVLIFLGPILYHAFYGSNGTLARGFLMRAANRTSPGLGLNMALVSSIVPICCTILLIHLAARVVKGPTEQDQE
ncbi:TRAP transporter small permease [Chachezhania antarctica]|uniref:TRAP transporter small permease n=1 Tax=Chachezhania antarctica TaxID=2340860 RepID=UPI000EAD472E|nr:TRAP transporter small permease [Chachezhania antarctica]|tara:strand:+ start:2871 stop:3380 length:510 start_codon:yes stop_codon:yes gene_type:complete